MISVKSLQNSVRQRTEDVQVMESIPVIMIKPNPYQPRKNFSQQSLEELSNSIKEVGLIQPITVRRTGINRYELIAGERRLRATKLAGLEFISAIIVSGDEKDSAIIAMIENLQREDLHYLEEARGYVGLISDHNLTQEELAKKVGKSQSTIANKIRLLRLSEETREVLIQNNLTERHARALLRLPVEELRSQALEKVIEKNYNVKETELLIERIICKIQRGKKQSGKKKIIRGYRDLRIFVNTIKEAVVMMKDYGLSPTIKEIETDNSLEITVIIPKE
ncbi:MAG TPA: ParB/RepB/Spo0J family partition protein [Clostridia bacterium]|nr:ParB/RepB/Spo0J family partition protein [Clostridia bacterium]